MNNIIKKSSLSLFGNNLQNGNPTSVYELNMWISDNDIYSIVFNEVYEEITFFVRDKHDISIRWFSRIKELPLCGHGALAVAHVLYDFLPKGALINISNLKDKLWLFADNRKPYIVLKINNIFSYTSNENIVNYPFLAFFNCGRDLLMLVSCYEDVLNFDATLIAWESHNFVGFIIASKPNKGVVYFRFFAPRAGISEDRASASVIPSLIQCSLLFDSNVNDLEYVQLSGSDVSFNVFSKNDLVYISGNIFEI
ncbi:PhzF family phenazine biosynthesis protein [Gilliamella sp. WF3-4]|uniref:PhzF family phenazine biosynthesis protein n=1 Tax=Gilliamella sp. WF3-4 TaxID=3120255 RepID=UPI00080ED302|nr:PhzF family phenazine biosynthesis protein [Gilliamella apicola]OCG16949.1 hypothetical protein A9G47_09855 [Gilliamella apicola]